MSIRSLDSCLYRSCSLVAANYPLIMSGASRGRKLVFAMPNDEP